MFQIKPLLMTPQRGTRVSGGRSRLAAAHPLAARPRRLLRVHAPRPHPEPAVGPEGAVVVGQAAPYEGDWLAALRADVSRVRVGLSGVAHAQAALQRARGGLLVALLKTHSKAALLKTHVKLAHES